MKIVIDGLTEEMVDGLCRKWGYEETVMEKQIVKDEVPDPDPKSLKDAMIMVPREVIISIPNPQSKEDFVKEYVINCITNEYRLIVRQDSSDESEKKAEEKVKKTKLK